MNFENFYMPVSVIFPKFNGKFSADVDVNWTAGAVMLGVIRMLPRVNLDCDKAVSQKNSLSPGKRFKKLNDFVVNEQPVIHNCSPEPVPSRRSNSSKVAKFSADLSIFSESFLR